VTEATETTSGELAQVLGAIKAFVEHEVVPLEKEHQELLENSRLTYSERGDYSPAVVELIRTVRRKSSEAGFYTLFAPTALGGAGMGSEAQFLVWETLAHAYGGGRLLPYQMIGHWTSGPSFLLGELHHSLAHDIVPDIMSGNAGVCFGMSEPDAGSDAWSMRTRARLDGDEWVLNGTKQWTSNAGHASYAFIWAVTSDELRDRRAGGISCFLVPFDSPGFRLDSIIRLFDHVGGNEAILSLNDVRIPAEYLVGTVDRGFSLALRGVSNGRVYNAGHCVGLARWALEMATEYAQSRTAFGHPISDYQGVSFMLADSAMEIYAARSMSLDCTRRLDRGESARKELDIVKAYTSEVSHRIIDRCMQVFGAMGMSNELGLADAWHHTRMVQTADGTGQIMRRNIANQLFKGDFSF